MSEKQDYTDIQASLKMWIELRNNATMIGKILDTMRSEHISVLKDNPSIMLNLDEISKINSKTKDTCNK